MHEETVSSTCLLLISELSKFKFLQDFYLVGGTALSLQLGHRISIDLDFFSSKEFRLNTIFDELKKHFQVEERRLSHTNILYELNGVKTEFVYYAYPPANPLIEWKGIKMLDPEDIGLFKLLALLGRHNKKDIVDLYFIDQQVISLEKLFAKMTQHYEKGDINLFKQLELLFDDETINATQMPEMLLPFDFESAYAQVKNKMNKAIRDYFGFPVN